MAGLSLAGLVLTAAGTAAGPVANAAPASVPPASTAGASVTTGVPGNPMRFTAAMQPGWNVGNSLDAIPDETSWGNPLISRALLAKVRSLGFRSIRVPVTWGIHEGAGPAYTIDPAFLARVKQVVNWALADGFYVVLDMHHDSWQWVSSMPSDPSGVLARFTATWTQIAGAFRDEPARLVLESINEPQFTGATSAQDTTYLRELNTSFYHVVRNSGGGNASRYLLLPTLGDTPAQALMDNLATTIRSLHDPHLIASAHFYGFWPFSVNIAGYTTYSGVTKTNLEQTFALLHSQFIARGIPVYAGEVGLLNYTSGDPYLVEHGEVLKFFGALGDAARANDVTISYWDDGSRILNRNTLKLFDPALFATIAASWRVSSGTASNDRVFLPRTGAITARTLTLNPHGNLVTGLYQGRERLRRGRDYTISGDTLTLTPALLTRLAGDRSYGTDATIAVRFSRGVPWSIHVGTASTPALASATGTTSSFTIPARFHGDLLSTMTAAYPDGSNAGPAGWTPYQEYGTSFSADYPGGGIVLTSAFLSSLTSGEPVTLTFGFWSGATVRYTVTRSGNTITGTAS